MYTFQSYYASEQFCAPFGEIGGGCIKPSFSLWMRKVLSTAKYLEEMT